VERDQFPELLESALAGPSKVVSLRSNVVWKGYRDLPSALCDDQFSSYGKSSRTKTPDNTAKRQFLSSGHRTRATAAPRVSRPRRFGPFFGHWYGLLPEIFDRPDLFHDSPQVSLVGIRKCRLF